MSSEEQNSSSVSEVTSPTSTLPPSSSSISLPLSEDSDSSTQDGKQQGGWELVDSLREAKSDVQKLEKQEGFLLKKRKWPMKGWHKRYFLLEKGILMYAKTLADLKKGKLRGRIDVGLSVMSIKKKAMCIDLDTEDSIYHLKVKTRDLFDGWVSQLRNHRVFRQNEIAMDPHERQLHPDSASLRRKATVCKQPSLMLKNSYLQSSEDMRRCCRDLSECETSLLELNLLLKNMEVLHRTFSAPSINTLQTEGSKKEKKGRRWRSRNHSKNGKNNLQASGSKSSRLHVSNPNLTYSEPNSPETETQTHLETPDSPIHASRLQEEFCRLASNVHATLKSAYSSLCSERDRVRNTLDLRNAHEMDVMDGHHPLLQQASNGSRSSIPDSLSEFFDANEYLLSASSSENELSDNDSCVSDVSDNVSVDFCPSETGAERENTDSSSVSVMPRRSRLPSACVSEGVNLWSILYSNIGKDLSKVSMPIQLNEPISTLQRLCEEMEYCHLLDTAAHTHDPDMRMVYVAAFAVSAYACSYTRAGMKPFNPILGETYECERPDKGFRFISEQVSHHPPVSACHCESKNFTLWQDVRWKNKFWGKTMEIVPMGTTHIVLPRFGDHYELNRVTSCIHNILSGQRWIEHYGEMTIRNRAAAENAGHCKVTFYKASSRGLKVNKVEAVVTDAEGRVVHSLFGKWNEALFLGEPPSALCVWRANPMPEDHEQFYGFTQFAIELNELDENIKPFLPPTDTRFRPDQRLLEEGNVSAAEEQKERIEALQRERRRVLQENNMSHAPRFFKRSEDDAWLSNGTYWELRKDPGFSKLDFPLLW
ncbi:oxysterol-binding protein-related protein 3a isoform X1 [Astyanax mexicanus]|uniref:oxysterol-binding protein-related protein 3a isoform X1 n=1 Tax=Astyanax mexicanus TaxID=7994 RepID=UPI0020CADBA8|nr:oxysterol-binding protein-related protein 3a isoform X1 [Astyanax mexicanus]XP_049331943.1 oxysterol-binding protein-related protein 3a isoform X1 [Astyanax mexicanus]XP_049331944.1 oxysterol-binding protein-related protein 3a isoform X1 [Astyanax mexicanus]XP_049331945.1 oxysterol-binding protein-related protein 3a isoform X1 [Astyanax mexicanus]